MNIGNLFGRLTIGTRVYAGFGLTLALLIAVGGISIVSLSAFDAALHKYSKISNNTVDGVTIDNDFLGLRRQVVAYSNSGNENALGQIRQIGPQLQKDLTKLIDGLAVAERKGMLQALQSLIDKYLAGVEEVVKLRAGRDKLVNERMNVLGPEARKKLSEVVDSAMKDGDFEAAAHVGLAQEQLLLVRLNAVRFLDHPNQKLVEDIKQEIVEFRHEVDVALAQLQNSARRKLAAEAKELVERYVQAFTELASASFELDSLVTQKMAEVAEKLSTGIDDFVKVQRDALVQVQKETDATNDQSMMTASALAIVAVLLGALIAFLIARSIVKPLTGLVGAMRKLADGDFSVVLPGLGRKDEVGQMAEAVEGFKIKAAEKAQREAEEKASADRQAATVRKAEMHRLADGFEAAVGNIVQTVSSASTELEAAATTLTKTAETTQHLSATVASASEEASANVQSVASATNEMAASVSEISRQVQESARIANEAVKQAEKTDGRITELSHAASRIGDVVKLITAIAEQTNLLALNATIEAARAGEAGKGFAVVAQEVKALAAQTGKATGEIGTQIAGMQAATQESVSAIKEIGTTINRIAEIASTIAAAVEEQGAATAEIARNVQQASQGTTQVASNITEVNRGASETGSASSQVLSSAQSLSSESSHLKIEVEKFLHTVRAA